MSSKGACWTTREAGAGVPRLTGRGTPLGASDEWAELRHCSGDGGGLAVDDEGRFRLPGLLDRDDCVRAWSSETGLVLVSDPVAAGTRGLVLRAGGEAARKLR